LVTTKKTNPYGYGRVFLKGDFIDRIVEEKDCDDLERENPLINAGVYCFNWFNLSEIINSLQSNNNQKEKLFSNKYIQNFLKNESKFSLKDKYKFAEIASSLAYYLKSFSNINKFLDYICLIFKHIFNDVITFC